MLLLLVLACHHPPETAPPDDTAGPDSGDSGDSGESGESADTAATLCPDGTPPRPFDPGGDGADHGALAGDLTVPTRDGDWTLSEAWTGCDSVVFLGVPSSSASYLSTLMDADPRRLFQRGPRDVHYVLFADGNDDHRAALAALIDGAIDSLDAEDAAWWHDHVHLATGRSGTLDGWAGELLQRYEYPLFGIDRAQRVREMGYLADPLDNWESTDWSYLGEEVNLYQFEHTRQATLDAEQARVVRVWDGVLVGGKEWGTGFETVDLGEAAAGATRVDVDLTLGCGGPWYEACPAWDTVNWLFVCDADGTNCTELARLVTGYWRGGRWVMDGTALLDRLQGEASFLYQGGEVRYLTLDLRFWDDGSGRVPLSSTQVWWDIYAFWDDAWNASHQDHVFTPPPDATKVELVYAVTGHGADRAGCAEFCVSRHEFTVNGGVPIVTEYSDAGSQNGCRDRVATGGVLPNQAGTWTYGRAGWCPGQGVEPVRVDISDQVVFGAENLLDYTAFHGDETARNTEANFDPSVVLVYSR